MSAPAWLYESDDAGGPGSASLHCIECEGTGDVQSPVHGTYLCPACGGDGRVLAHQITNAIP